MCRGGKGKHRAPGVLFFTVMQPFICLPALVLAVRGCKQVKAWQGAGSWRWGPSGSHGAGSAPLQAPSSPVSCCCCCCRANASPPAPRCYGGLGLMGLVFHLVTAFLLLLERLPCLSCNFLTSSHLPAVAFF